MTRAPRNDPSLGPKGVLDQDNIILVRGELGQDAPKHVVVAFKRDHDPAHSNQATIKIPVGHSRSSNLVTIKPVQVKLLLFWRILAKTSKIAFQREILKTHQRYGDLWILSEDM